MKQYEALLAGIAASWMAAGCAANQLPASDEPGEAEPIEVHNESFHLEQLRNLQVFEVGNMIVDMPAGSMNCYGPCPGFEDEIAAAEQAALERLARFAAVAERAVVGSNAEACHAEQIDSNLQALRALEVVQVGDLIEAVPENNPMCYNTPCQEDIEAAEALTCERAGKLADIATATHGY